VSAPAYVEIHHLNAQGRFAEALARLDELDDGGVHLWLRGWALHHLGRVPEAHAALARAEPLLSGANLGRMLMDRAALYGHERQFARAYDLHVRAWQHGRGDATHQALVTYNIGWQHLSRLHLAPARARLFEAMEGAERLTGADVGERVLTRTGLSTLERLSGQVGAALDRAAWALDGPPDSRHARLPHRALSLAHRHLGDLAAARSAQEQAVARSAPGVDRGSQALLLALIDRLQGRSVDLPALKLQAMPLDQVRADLHLADDARRAGRSAEALTRLRAVLALDEPFVVRDEAPSLHQLYALGREAGLTLPSAEPLAQPRRAALRALGAPELLVDGAPVPVSGGRSFALLTYLALYGGAPMDTLAPDVLPGVPPGQWKARLRAAAAGITRWLGDPEAVTVQERQVQLSPRWQVTVDVAEVLAGHGQARGAFLPGLYSEWTGRVQDLLDRQGH
jgi:tetratricopeptide (TPR) repeat protein